VRYDCTVHQQYLNAYYILFSDADFLKKKAGLTFIIISTLFTRSPSVWQCPAPVHLYEGKSGRLPIYIIQYMYLPPIQPVPSIHRSTYVHLDLTSVIEQERTVKKFDITESRKFYIYQVSCKVNYILK
jgi:hypothetical protein